MSTEVCQYLTGVRLYLSRFYKTEKVARNLTTIDFLMSCLQSPKRYNLSYTGKHPFSQLGGTVFQSISMHRTVN